MRKVSATVHDEKLRLLYGVYINHDGRERRLLILSAADKEHGTGDVCRVRAQVLVDDFLITFLHDGRQRAVFSASEVRTRKLGRNASYRTETANAQPIGKTAPRHDPGAPCEHRPVKQLLPRETLYGNSAAERMCHDVRKADIKRAERLLGPVRIVADRPRRAQRRRPSEPGKIQRGHAVVS